MQLALSVAVYRSLRRCIGGGGRRRRRELRLDKSNGETKIFTSRIPTKCDEVQPSSANARRKVFRKSCAKREWTRSLTQPDTAVRTGAKESMAAATASGDGGLHARANTRAHAYTTGARISSAFSLFPLRFQFSFSGWLWLPPRPLRPPRRVHTACPLGSRPLRHDRGARETASARLKVLPGVAGEVGA